MLSKKAKFWLGIRSNNKPRIVLSKSREAQRTIDFLKLRLFNSIILSSSLFLFSLIETDEIYDGYRTIYQQYFADEGCDFMISYSASGNSRVILNENEEIIEFLAYDRLSENEKCELYVLYRSKKNADGSWYTSEAEILDIFAYDMSTKEVVSSGKTSWSVIGNEKYYEVTGEK